MHSQHESALLVLTLNVCIRITFTKCLYFRFCVHSWHQFKVSLFHVLCAFMAPVNKCLYFRLCTFGKPFTLFQCLFAHQVSLLKLSSKTFNVSNSPLHFVSISLLLTSLQSSLFRSMINILTF